MRHWAGTLQSAMFNKRPRNNTLSQHHSLTQFTYQPRPRPRQSSTAYNGTSRVRFPADLLTWQNIGQGYGVKDTDRDERSPVTVAGIATLFVFCTITATLIVTGPTSASLDHTGAVYHHHCHGGAWCVLSQAQHSVSTGAEE